MSTHEFALPPLPLDVLRKVQALEKYARKELWDCCDLTARVPVHREPATRVLRTCVVAVFDLHVAYYASLEGYRPEWIEQLKKKSIDSVLALLPSWAKGEQFRDELTSTIRSHLTEPVGMVAEPQDVAKSRRTFIEPLLLERGWSVLDWANHANVAYHTASDYLLGHRRPYRSTRVKLAKALGLSPNRLPD